MSWRCGVRGALFGISRQYSILNKNGVNPLLQVIESQKHYCIEHSSYNLKVNRTLSSEHCYELYDKICLIMAASKTQDTLEASNVEMIENNREPDNEKSLDENVYDAQALHRMGKRKIEKTLLRKADLCIVPLAALAYLVSYLVRLVPLLLDNI